MVVIDEWVCLSMWKCFPSRPLVSHCPPPAAVRHPGSTFVRYLFPCQPCLSGLLTWLEGETRLIPTYKPPLRQRLEQHSTIIYDGRWAEKSLHNVHVGTELRLGAVAMCRQRAGCIATETGHSRYRNGPEAIGLKQMSRHIRHRHRHDGEK
jgi:hypothetical protein